MCIHNKVKVTGKKELTGYKLVRVKESDGTIWSEFAVFQLKPRCRAGKYLPGTNTAIRLGGASFDRANIGLISAYSSKTSNGLQFLGTVHYSDKLNAKVKKRIAKVVLVGQLCEGIGGYGENEQIVAGSTLKSIELMPFGK